MMDGSLMIYALEELEAAKNQLAAASTQLTRAAQAVMDATGQNTDPIGQDLLLHKGNRPWFPKDLGEVRENRSLIGCLVEFREKVVTRQFDQVDISRQWFVAAVATEGTFYSTIHTVIDGEVVTHQVTRKHWKFEETTAVGRILDPPQLKRLSRFLDWYNALYENGTNQKVNAPATEAVPKDKPPNAGPPPIRKKRGRPKKSKSSSPKPEKKRGRPPKQVEPEPPYPKRIPEKQADLPPVPARDPEPTRLTGLYQVLEDYEVVGRKVAEGDFIYVHGSIGASMISVDHLSYQVSGSKLHSKRLEFPLHLILGSRHTPIGDWVNPTIGTAERHVSIVFNTRRSEERPEVKPIYPMALGNVRIPSELPGCVVKVTGKVKAEYQETPLGSQWFVVDAPGFDRTHATLRRYVDGIYAFAKVDASDFHLGNFTPIGRVCNRFKFNKEKHFADWQVQNPLIE